MSETATAKKSIREELTPKRILVLVLTFILATMMMAYGWSTNCFGMFFIGIGLYMIPHMFGLNNIKLFTAYGVVFFVVVMLLGMAVMAPGVVADNSKKFNDKADIYEYSDITFGYDDARSENKSYTSAIVMGDVGTHEVKVRIWEIAGIGFKASQITVEKDFKEYKMELVPGGSTYRVYFDIDSSKLYTGLVYVTKTGAGGEEYNKATSSHMGMFKDSFKGDLNGTYFKGVLNATVYTMFMFFILLFMTAFMRSRLEKTRAKMEAEGRLYPIGYGRCDSCGAVVLPGEINCRKCGTYIDRPDDMKPKKVDYFTCSDCGAEVPGDATFCPKCKAKFDEDEPEIPLAKIINCSECGMELPETATFCPRCGKKF